MENIFCANGTLITQFKPCGRRRLGNLGNSYLVAVCWCIFHPDLWLRFPTTTLIIYSEFSQASSWLLLPTWFNFTNIVSTVISAWPSNYIHRKVWNNIIYPFPNFSGAAVSVWQWIRSLIAVWEWTNNFIPHFTQLRFKLIHVSKRDPWELWDDTHEIFLYIIFDTCV